MRTTLLLFVAVLATLGTLGASAQATLSPEAYETIRNRAPLVFGGVVLHDAGGRMDLRVEQVQRGALQPGWIVAVAYPEHRGALAPPGPSIYYRRFQPGERLMIWGTGGPVIQIVDGGIERVGGARPPAKSGGCGACALGAAAPSGGLGGPALLLLLALAASSRGGLRRRRLSGRSSRSPSRPCCSSTAGCSGSRRSSSRPA